MITSKVVVVNGWQRAKETTSVCYNVGNDLNLNWAVWLERKKTGRDLVLLWVDVSNGESRLHLLLCLQNKEIRCITSAACMYFDSRPTHVDTLSVRHESLSIHYQLTTTSQRGNVKSTSPAIKALSSLQRSHGRIQQLDHFQLFFKWKPGAWRG